MYHHHQILFEHRKQNHLSIMKSNIPTITSFSFMLDNVLGSTTQLVYNLNVSSGIETHCLVTSSLLKRRTTSFSLYSGTTA